MLSYANTDVTCFFNFFVVQKDISFELWWTNRKSVLFTISLIVQHVLTSENGRLWILVCIGYSNCAHVEQSYDEIEINKNHFILCRTELYCYP